MVALCPSSAMCYHGRKGPPVTLASDLSHHHWTHGKKRKIIFTCTSLCLSVLYIEGRTDRFIPWFWSRLYLGSYYHGHDALFVVVLLPLPDDIEHVIDIGIYGGTSGDEGALYHTHTRDPT